MREHGLDLPAYRLHRRCFGAVGQQRDLDQPAADFDAFHQPGRDDIATGHRVRDAAQRLPQRLLRGSIYRWVGHPLANLPLASQ